MNTAEAHRSSPSEIVCPSSCVFSASELKRFLRGFLVSNEPRAADIEIAAWAEDYSSAGENGVAIAVLANIWRVGRRSRRDRAGKVMGK